MRQKVGIAIAFAKKAKVLLLDEPASGLDPLASSELSETLKKLASKGEIRDGGSYEARMGSVECWNATMDENKYMVRKWNEMIAS